MANQWNITDSDGMDSVYIYGNCDPMNEPFCINGKCYRMYVKSSGDYYSPVCHCNTGYNGRRCDNEIVNWATKTENQTWTTLYLLNIFGIVLAITVLVLSAIAVIYYLYLKKKIRAHNLICDCTWIRSWLERLKNTVWFFYESVRTGFSRDQGDATVTEIECQSEADDTPLTPSTFSDSQLHNRRMSRDYDPAGQQEPKKFQRERLNYCSERIEV